MAFPVFTAPVQDSITTIAFNGTVTENLQESTFDFNPSVGHDSLSYDITPIDQNLNEWGKSISGFFLLPPKTIFPNF